ncbi:hypothetical protein QF037_009368 [Streptomyces canus]|nr:hypothetical protein [Streptomyces canus]
MIVVLAVFFRLFRRERLLNRAREQAEHGIAGPVEGHAPLWTCRCGSG